MTITLLLNTYSHNGRLRFYIHYLYVSPIYGVYITFILLDVLNPMFYCASVLSPHCQLDSSPDLDTCKGDTRQWNRIHLEAAGKIPSPSILALTPPSNEQYSARDVNAKGPGMDSYCITCIY